MKYLLLALLAALFLFPLYWMGTLSVQANVDIIKTPPDLIPRSLTATNYERLLMNFPVARWALNTLLVVAGTTLLSVAVSSLAGYAFAAFRFRGRGFLFGLFMAGIMITRYALFVPLFVVLARLGLRGIPAVILSTAFDPMGIYLFRTYMASHVPGSYCESARLDGAGDLQILRHIMAPLCTPILAAMIVFKAVNTIQDYVWQMIVLQRPQWYTLILGLVRAAFEQQISDGYKTDYGLDGAASMLMLIPLVTIFAFTSKYFIKGIGEGGVKG